MESMSMYAWLYLDMSFMPRDSRITTQPVFVAINSQLLAELLDSDVGTLCAWFGLRWMKFVLNRTGWKMAAKCRAD
ncbi:hypothetical protein EYC80_006203 [Monilinia laxa]|uniref:Uncharacterized protein n=1 Tax=Monilinia laxa TaxID=61186 RepID=A0A5N6KGS2_MONLA|nr:hypothetical protein EYC80_006203 [Monilinia laxa]